MSKQEHGSLSGIGCEMNNTHVSRVVLFTQSNYGGFKYCERANSWKMYKIVALLFSITAHCSTVGVRNC